MRRGPSIRFERVTCALGGITVLEDVSFTADPGEFLYVIGPNGGGKTTLLKLILGLVRPDGGRLSVLGLPPPGAARHIGYLPQYQHFDPLFPVTVLDVVRMGRLATGRPFFSRADTAAAMNLLGALGLDHAAGRPFSELSGGMRQRALTARALARDPELLLLDEPTSNVDPAFEGRLFEILAALRRTVTVLLVTHDLGVVPKRVRRVLCVNRSVHAHPTRRLTGRVLQDLYEKPLRQVLHGRSAGRPGRAHV